MYEIQSKVNASINPPLQSRSSEARDIRGWRRALDDEAESQHLERGFRQTPGSNHHPLEVVFTIITPLAMSFQRVVLETVCTSGDSALRCRRWLLMFKFFFCTWHTTISQGLFDGQACGVLDIKADDLSQLSTSNSAVKARKWSSPVALGRQLTLLKCS